MAEKFFELVQSFKGLDFWFEGMRVADGKKLGEELLGVAEFFLLLIDEHLRRFRHEELHFPSFNGVDELFFDELFQDVVGVDSGDFGFLSNGAGIAASQL